MASDAVAMVCGKVVIGWGPGANLQPPSTNDFLKSFLSMTFNLWYTVAYSLYTRQRRLSGGRIECFKVCFTDGLLSLDS
jgi:hypothetical protein